MLHGGIIVNHQNAAGRRAQRRSRGRRDGLVENQARFGGDGRQFHGEGGTLARFARDRDIAAHHLAELVADRQSQAGPPVFPRGRRVGLHERAI